MKKLIFALISLVILLTAVWWFFLKEEAPVAVSKDTVVEFPVDSNKDNVSVSKTITEQFDEVLASSQSADTWTTFKEQTVQQIVTELGAQVEPNLLSLLDPRSVQFYTCTDTDALPEVRSIVFSTHFALQKNNQNTLYQNQIKYLRTWEQSMLKDVASILYPTVLYPSKPTQVGKFSSSLTPNNVELHKVSLEFADKSEGFLGYIFIGDELLIGNNEKCLFRAQVLLFDTSA